MPEIVLHPLNPHEAGAPTAGGTASLSPIINHGGPVLGSVNVYLIWYGNWNQSNGSDTPAGQQIVRDFLNNVGGSDYYKINTPYGGVSGGVTFKAESLTPDPKVPLCPTARCRRW